MMEFVQVQPMTVAINAPVCLRLYKSGILSQNECDCTSVSYEEVIVNEVMTFIGFGPTTTADKEYAYCSGYWLLKASWGPSWGENGNIRLCIPRNREKTDTIGTCNVQTYPALPDMGIPAPWNNFTSPF